MSDTVTTAPTSAPAGATAGTPATAPSTSTGGEFNFDAAVDSLAISDEPTEATPAEDTSVDGAPFEDEVVDDESAPAEAAKPEGEAAPPVTEEELPEGVRKQLRRDGTPQYVMAEQTFRNMQDTAKLAGEFEAIIGEPLTAEAIANAAKATSYVRDMELDLMSPALPDQQRLAEHFVGLAKSRRESGEIDHNPMVSFVAHLASLDPDVDRAIRDTLGPEVLLSAIQDIWTDPKSDENLKRAAQYIAHYGFGDYNVEKILAKTAPVRRTETRPASARATGWQASPEQAHQDQSQAYGNWKTKANESVGKVLADAVKNILEPTVNGKVSDGYKDFPQQKKNLIGRLQAEATAAINDDPVFKAERDRILREAQITKSEQRRNDLLEQLSTKYKVRIARELDPSRNKAIKEILSEGARFVQTQANGRMERRAAAQSQKQPGSGAGAPVPKRIVPNAADVPAGLSTEERWEATVDRLSSTFR